jgi:hypothetical protein
MPINNPQLVLLIFLRIFLSSITPPSILPLSLSYSTSSLSRKHQPRRIKEITEPCWSVGNETEYLGEER